MKPSIDKTIIDKTNAWPFVEAKKILKERKQYIEKKKKIILQTGYGPSGLPHIGTFGEVARTTMILNAIKSCLLYTSPSPRDGLLSRMPSSA